MHCEPAQMDRVCSQKHHATRLAVARRARVHQVVVEEAFELRMWSCFRDPGVAAKLRLS